MTQTHNEDEPLHFRRSIRRGNPMASGGHPSALPYATGDIWGNNPRPRPSRDNGDRPNNPIGTRNPSNNNAGWSAHSNSRTPSASPEGTRGRAESNGMSHLANQLGQLRPFDNPIAYAGPSAGIGTSEGTINPVNYAATRGTSSRQSPSFGASHTPSNSIHSQRGMHSYTQPRHNHTASQQGLSQQALNHQVLNQQAFGFNNVQGLDEQSVPLHHLLPNNRVSSFQFNPNSQTWNHDSATNHASNSSLGGNNDLSTTYPLSSRFALNRVDQGGSPFSINPPLQSSWNSRDSGSRPLESESDRRMPSQQQYSNYIPGLYNAYSPQGVHPHAEAFLQSTLSTVVPVALSYQGSGYEPTGAHAHRGNNQHRTMRDPWVAAFAALIKNPEKRQQLTLDALAGHVVDASGDQDVSRFIQSKLQSARSDEKERLFNEIGPDMVPLMRDVYGNYVIQRLIEHGSQAQKARMVEAVKGHAVELSMNAYGCRVFQRLVETCLVHQIADLLQEMQDIDVLKSLMQHDSANHVIQKVVVTLPSDVFRFITIACQRNAREVSTQQNSCRVVQRVLEHADQDDVRTLLTELHPLMDKLVTDNWGNYVAGHIIKHKKEDRESIFNNIVMKRLLMLCQHKLASHVVEKCIEHGTPEQRTQIRQQLSPANDADNTLYNMLRDQYANYVVGCLLKHLEWGSEERRQFKAEVVARITLLKTAPGGASSKTITSMEKIFAADSEREEKEGKLQVDVPSSTPELTNETNSPQSDSPPSADTSAIEASPTNPKSMEINLQIQDNDA